MRALILLLCLCCAASAAPKKAVPLDVKGDTVVIVKSFPCTVTAPPGADFYVWRVPAGVTAGSDRNVLTVTGAPNGEHRVTVQTVTWLIDFDKKTKEIVEDSGATSLVVGGVPEPTPPVPPGPTPDATLAKSLADALATDNSPDKAGLARKLGGMYRAALKSTLADAAITTVGQLDTVVRDTANQMVGVFTIPATRDAIGKYLAANCPTGRAAALDDAARQKYRSAYLALADALEGLK